MARDENGTEILPLSWIAFALSGAAYPGDFPLLWDSNQTTVVVVIFEDNQAVAGCLIVEHLRTIELWLVVS